jgi:hypothetical protein
MVVMASGVLGIGSVLFLPFLARKVFHLSLFFMAQFVLTCYLFGWNATGSCLFCLVLNVWCFDGFGRFGFRLSVEGMVCFRASVCAAWFVVSRLSMVVNRFALQ